MKVELRGRQAQVIRRENWLAVRFPAPQVMLSWAIHGGGRRKAEAVVWYQVKAKDLEPPVDPPQFLHEKLLQIGMPDSVGLLTSADLDRYVDVERSYGGVSARVIATVGLSNALRVGDPPAASKPVGTINLLCHLSAPLSEEAHLEALSIAVEARSTAVLDASIPSTQTQFPATGTGTDCVVMAAPWIEESIIRYAGKHTEVGHLIGEVVLEAMRLGIQTWRGA